jgi:alpha-L-fucosidase
MKKLICLILVAIALSSQCFAQPSDTRMDWWKEAKFGLFVHWGLFSVAGGDWKGKPYKGGEHFMLWQKIPLKEYATIASQLNPTKFNADAWVKAAKDAGMRYIVVTTKHHEGFAMFNSPSNEYNIVKASPYGKDPMAMLAKSCKKYGLKLCFYYSLGRDWADPDVPTNWPTKGGRSNTWDYPNEDAKDFSKYFERKVKPQVKELLTQYGPVGVMWFDTPEMIGKEHSKELRELIVKLQPKCIINERIGNGEGDFNVSEQKLNKSVAAKPWESCITISRQWGYNKYDTTYKSPEVLVRNLIEVASADGNFLLNVGPNGEGEISAQSLSRLASVGEWMKVNGESIYGTHAWKVQGEKTDAKKEKKEALDKNNMKDVFNDATSQKTPADIRFTAKGKVVYVFVRSWKSPDALVKAMAAGKENIKSVQLLGYKPAINWKQTEEGLVIKLPANYSPTLPIYTFKVTLQ